MSAGAYDITCEQGATFSRILSIFDSDGNARDLSGYTARMQVRRTAASTTTIVELTTENGRITLNSSGEVTLGMSAQVTAGITDGGVYDLEIESPDGVVERVIEGNFYLYLEVTR